MNEGGLCAFPADSRARHGVTASLLVVSRGKRHSTKYFVRRIFGVCSYGKFDVRMCRSECYTEKDTVQGISF